jgi:hypothetical protein
MADDGGQERAEFFESRKRKKYKAKYRKRVKYRKIPITQ